MTTSPENWPTYRYRADLVRIIDGDTIRVRCDLGMYITRTVNLRIADIDAPEIYGRDSDLVRGRASAEALEQVIIGRTLYIATNKDKKSFDRYVCDLYVEGDDGAWIDVAAWMVEHGWAVRV